MVAVTGALIFAAVVLAVAASVVVVVWRLIVSRHRIDHFWPWWSHRKIARRAAELGCDRGRFCDNDRRHGPCHVCGRTTCQRGGYVEPSTLRRRTGYVCRGHSFAVGPRQTAARADRCRVDWERLTDPVDSSRLALGQLPEQYRGAIRAALRAFVDSDAETAVCVDLDAGDLNASIRTLGLTEIYAEQRANETVLRRVATPAKKRATR